MSITAVAYFEPKEGARLDECEDAAAYRLVEGDFTAAVSDGAGSSYKAAAWSQRLVQSFVANTPFLDSHGTEFKLWLAHTANAFQERSEQSSGDASWYASDASRRGSFATFVGVQTFRASAGQLFSAVLVGDACLFHIRQNVLLHCLPTSDPDGFDTTPDLLKSSAYNDSHGDDNALFLHGKVEPGDVFFLTSDALGSALLQMSAVNQPIWQVFARIGAQGFSQAVRDLRQSGVMEDDDVMLLRIRCHGSSP